MFKCARVVASSCLLVTSVSLFAQAVPASLYVVSTTDSTAVLSWVPGSADPGTFNVYYSTASGVTPANAIKSTKSISAPPYPVSGLRPNTQYYFVVTAVNGSGIESVASAPAQGTTSADPAGGGSSNSVMGTATKPAAASSPTTNVGSSSTTNVQNAGLSFTPFSLSSVPILPVAGGVPTGSLTYIQPDVQTLVSSTCNPSSAMLNDGSTYFLINVLNLTGTAKSQTIKSNNWYVYSQDKHWYGGFYKGWHLSDFDGATRLYGAENIFLLSILLNDTSDTGADVKSSPQIAYTFTVTKQQATNVGDVLQLLSLVLPAPAAGLQDDKTTPTPVQFRACSRVPIAYKTSSIKVDTSYTSGAGSPFSATQGFTNEGKEHWDVSFAFPIKKASALQYSSTANTVTASQINKQNLFAVADWYPVPVNLSATSTSLWPSFFGGVAMDSQPLHSLLFGASVGIHLAQVYAGALLIKQQDLSGLAAGSSASQAQVNSATSYGYKASFSVGIKISIRSAATALSSGSK